MEGVIFRTKGNSSNGINMCEMHNVLTIFIYVFLQTSLGQWFFFSEFRKHRRVALHCIRERKRSHTTSFSHTGIKYERLVLKKLARKQRKHDQNLT
jgi:hypothetical protein